MPEVATVEEIQTGVSVRVNRKALYEALRDVWKIVPTRSTLPVLSEVRLRAEGDSLHVAGTDLDYSIIQTIPAGVDTPGTILAPCKKLKDLAYKLPGEWLDIEAVGEDKIRVTSESGTEFEMYTLVVDEFPELPRVEDAEVELSLSAEHLLDICESFPDFCSGETSRPILNAMLFDGENQALVATNGHYLLTEPLEMPGFEDAVLIPGEFFSKARVIVKRRDADEANVAFEENHARIAIGNTVFFSRTVEGPYPNWKQVIPVGHLEKLRVSAGREELIEANEQVSLMASDQTHRVRWTVEEGTLKMKATAPDRGTATAAVEADTDAPTDIEMPFEIGFNANYVAQVLSNLRGESVDIYMIEPERATIFRGDGERFALLMPLRLLD